MVDTEGPAWREDARDFEALFESDEDSSLDVFAELFEDDTFVEHAPGAAPTVSVGRVGPAVDGTVNPAHVAIVWPASAGGAPVGANTLRAGFTAKGHTVVLDQAPGAPFPAKKISTVYDLAGTDAQRLTATTWGLFDPATQAMVGGRGGYGVMRILPQLAAHIQRNPGLRDRPKRIAGYSDITALLLACHSLLGWASLHGSVLVDNAASLNALVDALVKEPRDLYRLGVVARLTPVGRASTGRVRGVLLGGNLSLVEALYGSPFLPSLEGAILFLEDVNEPEYKIDRMLHALKLRGILDEIVAVVLGYFTDMNAARTAALIAESWGIPCAHGLQSGHQSPNKPLWIGLEYELHFITDHATLYLRR
jgi:muramoyltetrapeptide carboxypeptidase